MGVVRAPLSPMPPCPPDSDFFDYRQPGRYTHARAELEGLWARIWNRWKDRILCQDWWDHRTHASIEGWTHGFSEMNAKEQELAREGVTLQRRFAVAKKQAESYDANPELAKKLADRRKKQLAYRLSAPPPVQVPDDRRAWWDRFYASHEARRIG